MIFESAVYLRHEGVFEAGTTAKPGLIAAVRDLKEFWFEIAIHPKDKPASIS